MNQNPTIRIGAIDVLRALTMLLMIFVNDLWSLKGIPDWLEHVSADADGMGLADTVFPAFLFIVGMSTPFAIRNRMQKGESMAAITGHITLRGLALLVMGLFLVNGEYINEAASGISRGLWNVLACTGFILIWNQYPRTWNATLTYALKAIGIITLLMLAFRYKGGEGDNLSGFTTWWWGILGLIGWAYLVGALLYAWSSGNRIALWAGWLISMALCTLNHLHLLPSGGLLRTLISPIGEGSMTAFTIGGAIASEVFWKEVNKQPFQWKRLLGIFLAAGVVLIIAGFLMRPVGGISKIRATPSWVLICSGITLLVFLVVYWLVDLRKKGNWFSVIRPAGTETLLCYLIPYYAYAVVLFTGWSLPAFLLTGGVGLIKSLLFSVLVIVLAGLLTRRFLKLRL
ncbi:DUF5009 domain-containing protein [Flavihumibacter petaseus]|uniref:DUF5009 domain-containing protein n=1 Tax=Flavihumibacter petaseus NBRC 106054 TaxID=1220578 RepID=A0A0E9N526_9BACT|nr:DUF5009 domain-containing protein [Flavihumibacter petaseus]GAO44801.1 hypothetical protein FPE01S_04_00440 [Flavihumibacter petaseus NBRC 106054]